MGRGRIGQAMMLVGGYNSREGQLCPVCNSSDKPLGGRLRKIRSKFKNKNGKNKFFFGCNRYPDCKYTAGY